MVNVDLNLTKTVTLADRECYGCHHVEWKEN